MRKGYNVFEEDCRRWSAICRPDSEHVRQNLGRFDDARQVAVVVAGHVDDRLHQLLLVAQTAAADDRIVDRQERRVAFNAGHSRCDDTLLLADISFGSGDRVDGYAAADGCSGRYGRWQRRWTFRFQRIALRFDVGRQ